MTNVEGKEDLLSLWRGDEFLMYYHGKLTSIHGMRNAIKSYCNEMEMNELELVNSLLEDDQDNEELIQIKKDLEENE